MEAVFPPIYALAHPAYTLTIGAGEHPTMTFQTR